jgi:hypothetical protein
MDEIYADTLSLSWPLRFSDIDYCIDIYGY